MMGSPKLITVLILYFICCNCQYENDYQFYGQYGAFLTHRPWLPQRGSQDFGTIHRTARLRAVFIDEILLLLDLWAALARYTDNPEKGRVESSFCFLDENPSIMV